MINDTHKACSLQIKVIALIFSFLHHWLIYTTIPINKVKFLLFPLSIIPVRMLTGDTEVAYIRGPSVAEIIAYWIRSAVYNTERREKQTFMFKHQKTYTGILLLYTHSHSLINNHTVTPKRQQSNATVQKSKKYLKIYNYYLQLKYTVYSYYRYSVWSDQNVQQYVQINFICLEHYKYNK